MSSDTPLNVIRLEMIRVPSSQILLEMQKLAKPSASKLIASLQTSRRVVGTIKERREIYEYEAACLFVLASQYDSPDAHILEIGTAVGYSASIIAQAAPQASIITLNPKPGEFEIACDNLRRWTNVRVLQMTSMDYLKEQSVLAYNLIFVDGDHKHIALDLPWFNFLLVGGLMLFHDYSPEWSTRPCPPVFDALNAWGKDFDVKITDSHDVGLAGFYRRRL